MFKLDLETRDQIANIHWLIDKAREFQKNVYFCFTDYAKAFETDGNTRPPYLSPENLYAGQETTDRTRHRTTDWFKIRKEYNKAVHCHPAY